MHSASSGYVLRGLSHEDAQRLIRVMAATKVCALARLEADLKADHEVLNQFFKDLSHELNVERYLAARDRDRIAAQISVLQPRIEQAHARAECAQARAFEISTSLREVLKPLLIYSQRTEQALAARNERFVEEELLRWRKFFDHCEERPLTDEQARAAITFEENTLLVAAAGSGKTSTVVGKVAYALAKGIAQPQEVLCLAFNNKAALEIQERLSVRLAAMVDPDCPIDPQIKQRLSTMLAGGAMITSRTFHALGLQLIGVVEKTSVMSSQAEESSRRVRRAIEHCQRDPFFLRLWLLLQTVVRFPRPSDILFRNPKEYASYLQSLLHQRKGARGNGQQMEGIRSLGCTKLVASIDELEISNWLYVMGVEFEYDLPFTEGAALLCPGKIWTPDFTYRVQGRDGKAHTIVHEHFGLNRKGEAPKWFDRPENYPRQAQAKQDVLRQLDARHFWTTSADLTDGTLFDKLEQKLVAAGVQLKPRGKHEVLAQLKAIGQDPDNRLIEIAVSQIRQNGWQRPTQDARLVDQPEPLRARWFLDVVWPVVDAVNDLLVADKRIDFDEMIRRALKHLQDDPKLLPFKFILADEFQDTAPGRGELIRKILHARDDSLFFAVGDDWQAINRFAGSDLRFFHRFGEEFNRRPGAHVRCDLSRTFRSNQGIANVARQFVLKNKSQLPKEVDALDKNDHGVIDVRFFANEREVLPQVEATLERWVAQHPKGNKPSVFLLGRYGETHAGGLTPEQLKELNQRWEDRIELFKPDEKSPPTMYMTMHKSKGLQADYVLILGLFRAEYDRYCFPSEREDDPLLQLVLPPKEALADAEERRLFYVAMTRAKHQVVMLAHAQYPSPYAVELLRDHQDGTVLFNGGPDLPAPCPACDQGMVLERYNPKSKKPFYACSERRSCGKTWPQSPVNLGRPAQQRSA